VISGRKLKGADLTERTAFFETYGMLAGPDGLKTLKAMLEPRGLLRKKEVPEIRACAAMAIGKIRSAEAREVLARNASDKDPLVRNAVGRALKEND
jgi:HEAT repeat protein